MLCLWSTYAVLFWSGDGSGLDKVLLHLMSELMIPSGKVFRLCELFSSYSDGAASAYDIGDLCSRV